MSLTNKFLALWLEFDEVYREDKTAGSFKNVSELADVLAWIKRFGEDDIESCNNTKREYGILRIKVSVDGMLVPCEIRLNRADDINAGYSFIKRVTNEQGEVAIQVPAGTWQLEVSHGLTVESAYEEIEIKSGETLDRKINLHQFIDLKKMGWYNGELHHHSIYSSPVYNGTDDVVDTPGQVRLSMQAAGCDFGALSDHHNILNHEEWKHEERDNFVPVISKEISTSNGHVMAMGVKEDVIYNIPYGSNRTEEVLRYEFVRVAQEIRDAGGIPQVNHPFSDSVSTSWQADFSDLLSAFASVEIWNGANPMLSGNGNGKAFELWIRLLNEGMKISATAGSDTHCIKVNQYEKIKEQLYSIMKLIVQKRNHIPDNLQNRIRIIEEMWNKSYPVLNNWIRMSLGTAGVRNYVYSNNDISQKKILDAIHNGRIFITNGPLIFPEIGGAGPGETWRSGSSTVDVNIRVWSKKMPEEICLYLSDGQILKKQIMPEHIQNFYYYGTFTSVDVRRLNWIVCTAGTDCNNLAIANPIWLCKS